jgi:hypothetical protein
MNDRYGDMGWEDETDQLEGLEDEDGEELDFNRIMERADEHSFDEDFAAILDEALGEQEGEPDNAEEDEQAAYDDYLAYLASLEEEKLG